MFSSNYHIRGHNDFLPAGNVPANPNRLATVRRSPNRVAVGAAALHGLVNRAAIIPMSVIAGIANGQTPAQAVAPESSRLSRMLDRRVITAIGAAGIGVLGVGVAADIVSADDLLKTMIGPNYDVGRAGADTSPTTPTADGDESQTSRHKPPSNPE